MSKSSQIVWRTEEIEYICVYYIVLTPDFTWTHVPRVLLYLEDWCWAVEFLAAVPKKSNHMTPKSLPQSHPHPPKSFTAELNRDATAVKKRSKLLLLLLRTAVHQQWFAWLRWKNWEFALVVLREWNSSIVGRKNHWLKVNRWTTTPNFKAAIDARCAMPTPPRLKRRAKLLNHWKSGSRKRKVGLSRI